jgi:hypothetical protein
VTSVILVTCEAEIGRIMVWGQLRQIVCETPISKITRAKWTGGVALGIEHLLCKHVKPWVQTPVPPTPANITPSNFIYLTKPQKKKVLKLQCHTTWKLISHSFLFLRLALDWPPWLVWLGENWRSHGAFGCFSLLTVPTIHCSELGKCFHHTAMGAGKCVFCELTMNRGITGGEN